MIILEDANSSEYLRWRYWEEIGAACAAQSPVEHDQHFRDAEFLRLKLETLGQTLPASRIAIAARRNGQPAS